MIQNKSRVESPMDYLHSRSYIAILHHNTMHKKYKHSSFNLILGGIAALALIASFTAFWRIAFF